MQLHCDLIFSSTDIIYGTIDTAYFERVFWNLFQNADKAMSGKADARIEFSTWSDEGITFRVEDNGPGIAPDLTKETLNFGETLRQKGRQSGIGLYNCKKIVEAHGGKLWFTSKIGKGTSFFIHLPE